MHNWPAPRSRRALDFVDYTIKHRVCLHMERTCECPKSPAGQGARSAVWPSQTSDDRRGPAGDFGHSPGIKFKLGVATITAARRVALLANTDSIRCVTRLASGRYRGNARAFHVQTDPSANPYDCAASLARQCAMPHGAGPTSVALMHHAKKRRASRLPRGAPS